MEYSFENLVEIMEKLRSKNGCPWDKEQDTRSLLPYLIEESCEFIDAVYASDIAHQCEELGDVLFQVVFHAQVASEKGNFSINDVVREICEKMIHRHPHVFGNARADNASAVVKRWEEIKAQEHLHAHEAKASAMDKVSKSMPALARAQELQRRAAKAGFDRNNAEDSFKKVLEELEEFKAALDMQKTCESSLKNNVNEAILVKQRSLDKEEEEFGDLLFSMVNFARHCGLNAATALMRANAKFERRYRQMEEISGESLKGLSKAALLELWNKVKALEMPLKKE